ncbi:MAG: cellulase family glycosylhydrolase [Anaerolineaceae bacterium]|nr:cellulase family glycosylhydrolase [Anaerolineaceae bacterium]
MKYYGFNFQWMFADSGAEPAEPDERALDFLAAYKFNFVRIPTDYRIWTPDFDYFQPNESYFNYFDRYLHACTSRQMHLSLNMHRVPGYCINGNHLERDNLWVDSIAQDGLVYQWEQIARHFAGVPAKDLSFDLINEPPMPGQYGMTREKHAAIIRRVVAAIRAIDPQRLISIDGLDGGAMAMPELTDLNVTHSGRGYAPHAISHYQADWWPEWRSAPQNPSWPGLVYNGKIWNKDTLREVYQSWCEVQSQGIEVHIGEMGCFDQLDNDIALAWFKDLLGLFHEFRWGFALWNFEGPFGIINHRRKGAHFEKLHGYVVDRDMLQLILDSRVQ